MKSVFYGIEMKERIKHFQNNERNHTWTSRSEEKIRNKLFFWRREWGGERGKRRISNRQRKDGVGKGVR